MPVDREDLRSPCSMTFQILLVEDTDHLGESIRDILTMEGYSVVWVTNGEAGVDAFKGKKFDVVITDIVMPGMDGLQLIKEIRHFSAKLPIIVLSAKATPEDKRLAMGAGATAYITKPCGLDQLIAAVRSFVLPTLPGR